jgi:hypothetical protein
LIPLASRLVTSVIRAARRRSAGMPQTVLRAASLRFNCNEIGDIMSEVVAGGTAVTVKPAIVAETGTIPETAAPETTQQR